MGILRIKFRNRMAPGDKFKELVYLLEKLHVDISMIKTYKVPGEDDYFEDVQEYSSVSDVSVDEDIEATIFGRITEVDIPVMATLYPKRFASVYNDAEVVTVKDEDSLVSLYHQGWLKERLGDIIQNHVENIEGITLAEDIYKEDLMDFVFYWRKDPREVASDFVDMLEEDAKESAALRAMLKPYKKPPIVNALANSPFVDYLKRQGAEVNISVETGSVAIWGNEETTMRALYVRFRDHFVNNIGKFWITEDRLIKLFEDWLSENRMDQTIDQHIS